MKRLTKLIAIITFAFLIFAAIGSANADAAGTTGFVKQNGEWVFLRDGNLDSSFTGFAKSTYNGQWYYAKNGKLDWNYTGLGKSVSNGKWYYAKNGKLDWNYTGTVKHGAKYYVVKNGAVTGGFTGLVKEGSSYYGYKNGSFASDFTGVVKNHSNGNWYYVKNGVYTNTYTGLARSITNGKWYYVSKGKLNWNYTGTVKYGKKYYSVKKGAVTGGFTGLVKEGSSYYGYKNGNFASDFTGVVKNHSNGNWYYVKNGVYTKNYTGLAKSITNGKWYYVSNGKLNWNYTGLVKHGDKYYAVKKGAVANDFTGACQNLSNKKWYYVKNGVYTKGFNGVAKSIVDSKAYYMKNSVIDASYSGIFYPGSGSNYYVKEGVAYNRDAVLNSNLENKNNIAAIMASKATQYTYEIKPILAPFGKVLFIKTENPDPESFALIDSSSKYSETIWTGDIVYADVAYDNQKTHKVAGGYIFTAIEGTSDGGNITLMCKESGKYTSDIRDHAIATNKSIKAGTYIDFTDYLISNYTDSTMSFFDKMSAIQAAVDDINIYPFTIIDRNKEGYTKYPYMQVPAYKDQSWMYKEYSSIGGSFDGNMLAIRAYPIVSDSIGTPSFLGGVAKKLNPKCTVAWDGDYHYLVKVTYNGESRYYGGAGSGGDDALFSDRIIKDFRFTGASNDYAKGLSISKLRNRLMAYKEYAKEDKESYSSSLEGEEYTKAVGKGAWLRTRYGSDYRYVYATKGPDGQGTELNNVWVDGKYIDSNYRIEWGAKLADHPMADILLHNITYVDKKGTKHTNEDVLYQYDSDKKQWIAGYYYNGGWSYSSSDSFPKELILSKTQVNNLKVDQYSKAIPDTTLCYDGSLYPGTSVKTVRVTGVSTASAIKAKVGQTLETYLPEQDFKCVITPSNASLTETYWKSSNPAVADFEYYMGRYLRLECKKKGTVTVTVYTADGNYKATCKVTIE